MRRYILWFLGGGIWRRAGFSGFLRRSERGRFLAGASPPFHTDLLSFGDAGRLNAQATAGIEPDLRDGVQSAEDSSEGAIEQSSSASHGDVALPEARRSGATGQGRNREKRAAQRLGRGNEPPNFRAQ